MSWTPPEGYSVPETFAKGAYIMKEGENAEDYADSAEYTEAYAPEAEHDDTAAAPEYDVSPGQLQSEELIPTVAPAPSVEDPVEEEGIPTVAPRPEPVRVDIKLLTVRVAVAQFNAAQYISGGCTVSQCKHISFRRTSFIVVISAA